MLQLNLAVFQHYMGQHAPIQKVIINNIFILSLLKVSKVWYATRNNEGLFFKAEDNKLNFRYKIISNRKHFHLNTAQYQTVQ